MCIYLYNNYGRILIMIYHEMYKLQSKYENLALLNPQIYIHWNNKQICLIYPTIFLVEQYFQFYFYFVIAAVQNIHQNPEIFTHNTRLSY